jgi:hypothetical protein
MQRGAVELKAGSRLKSATDTTEVIVVKTPVGELDLRCGGVPLRPMEGEHSSEPIQAGFEEGSLIGKRYADEDLGLEVLCTKGGPASLSVGTALLAVKGAKALPASD